MTHAALFAKLAAARGMLERGKRIMLGAGAHYAYWEAVIEAAKSVTPPGEWRGHAPYSHDLPMSYCDRAIVYAPHLGEYEVAPETRATKEPD